MNRIKYRTRTELINNKYSEEIFKSRSYHGYVTKPINEKSKESFNRPAYQGLFSKRSDKK